jgi:hypothetical protein
MLPPPTAIASGCADERIVACSSALSVRARWSRRLSRASCRAIESVVRRSLSFQVCGPPNSGPAGARSTGKSLRSRAGPSGTNDSHRHSNLSGSPVVGPTQRCAPPSRRQPACLSARDTLTRRVVPFHVGRALPGRALRPTSFALPRKVVPASGCRIPRSCRAGRSPTRAEPPGGGMRRLAAVVLRLRNGLGCGDGLHCLRGRPHVWAPRVGTG